MPPNPPRRCIFCGDGNLSKEHIFARWLLKYMPDLQDSGSSHHVTLFSGENTENLTLVKFDEDGPLALKGDHRARGLKVVCKSCNETWMSRIQTRVMPVLKPMLVGQWGRVPSIQQRALAAWAVLLTMVFEQADKRTIAVPPEDRKAFCANQTPGEHWLVWAAPFNGIRHNGTVWHRGVGLIPHGKSVDPATERCNTQITAFAVGKCAFVTLSTQRIDVLPQIAKYARRIAARIGLNRIWPPLRLYDVRMRPWKTTPLGDEEFAHLIPAMSTSLSEDGDLLPPDIDYALNNRRRRRI